MSRARTSAWENVADWTKIYLRRLRRDPVGVSRGLTRRYSRLTLAKPWASVFSPGALFFTVGDWFFWYGANKVAHTLALLGIRTTQATRGTAGSRIPGQADVIERDPVPRTAPTGMLAVPSVGPLGRTPTARLPGHKGNVVTAYGLGRDGWLGKEATPENLVFDPQTGPHVREL